MKFTKPVGATADLRELEYMSALHQTGETLREDGTITASDVSKFLMSRYGIKASQEEVAATISMGFGGGGISESDGDTLDLTEIMAMLLVPTLLKAEMSLHRDHLERELIKHSHKFEIDPQNPDLLQSSKAGEAEEAAEPGAKNRRISIAKTLLKSGMDQFYDGFDDFDEVESLKFHECKAGNRELWEGNALRGELRWPDSDLIPFVLGMILKDVTGNDAPKPLTKELLQKIFIFYGEHDVAEDEELIQEMISVARQMRQSDEEDIEVLLDKFTFAHCLTDDVRKYDVRNETKLSTNYFDVFRTHKSTKENKSALLRAIANSNGSILQSSHRQDEEPVEEKLDGMTREVEMTFTMPSIDYAVDAFRSKTFVILLWVTWVLFYSAFMYGKSTDVGNYHCEDMDVRGKGFWCRIAQGIVDWLFLMTKLVIVGSGFVILASFGQSVNPTNPIFVVLGMTFISIFTIVPCTLNFEVLSDGNGGAAISTDKYDLEHRVFLYNAILSCGVMLLLLSIQNFLDRLLPEKYLDSLSKQILSSGTARMERNMKLAASFKLNNMVRNARAVHQDAEFDHGSSGNKDSSYGRALLSYSKKSDLREECGGYIWTWRRLRDTTLFTEDGVWLNNRVLQGNLGQLFLCLFLTQLVVVVTDFLTEVHTFFTENLKEEFNYQIPAKWRFTLPLGLAILVAEMNAIMLAAVYIPSSVRTIFSFRYGTIGSLHDGDFLKLRKNTDDSTFIFASMFWGSLVSSVLVFFVTFIVFAIICFEPFLDTLLALIATVIGLGIAILVKVVLLQVARKYFLNGAFYRLNPGVANVIGVVLEAWNLGITTLYVVKRMATLVAAAFIFIGRIDIPFLAEGADEIGPVVLDKFPFIFRKDLLTHEAHRHPYLERLGVMYMMKLRHGENFGREAGTSWRLLFVFALMPWLRKYRIRTDENMDMTKFIFAEDGPVFQSFVKKRASGSVVRRLTTKGEPHDGTIENQEQLRAENEALKQEVARLEQVETEVEELRNKMSSLMMNSIA